MRYPKECILKACEEAVIRPLESADRPMVEAFYAQVPESDRWFMNYDVMDSVVVDRWFEAVEKGKIGVTLSLCEGRVVGQASLYMREFGATSHVGRFRILVLPAFRQKRLGTWLMLDLIQLAMDHDLEALRTDLVVGIEDGAIEAAKKFDFFKHAELEDYVKDINGHAHNQVIMIKRLHRDWSNY